MNFKLWLNENVDYVWDSTRKRWEPGIHPVIPTDIAISIFNNKTIDVDNSSPNNPRLAEALRQLIIVRPEIKDYVLHFDGYKSNLTVEMLIGLKQDDMPDIVYTGTSFARWQKIQSEGLKPRSMTGSEPVYGKHKPSHIDKIYFSTTIGNTVKFAAREASRDGSQSVILAVNTDGMRPNLLGPDEDSDVSQWKDSIHILGTFSYRGIIKPQYIKLYMIWNNDTQKWETV